MQYYAKSFSINEGRRGGKTFIKFPSKIAPDRLLEAPLKSFSAPASPPRPGFSDFPCQIHCRIAISLA
jgi:hypothetical protein